jgi:AraC-like DNA-binding protein/quercetin dioxygenase-like cupin family protein
MNRDAGAVAAVVLFRATNSHFFRNTANSLGRRAMSYFAVMQAHDAGDEVADHAHTRGQLSVVLSGTMTVTSNEGWWLAPPGLAVWIPANVTHAARYSESSSLILLQVDAHHEPSLSPRCTCVLVSDLLKELAREAVRLAQQDAQDDELGLIWELTVRQIRRPIPPPALFVPHGSDRRVRLVAERLHRDPGCNDTLDELAGYAHTSPRTLARLFVTETGMTFGRWREHLRVVSAVDRLARGHAITAVAMDLGYQSASSFTTLFTRVLGAPPRRYMTSLQASIK